MRRLGRVVGGLLLGGLLACRARATSTTQPSDSQLEDERARVSRGEDVGASLRAPEIEVDGAGLRVNRELVAPTATLTPTPPQGKARESRASVAPLLVHLRALREHWTKIHPGRELAGAATVTLAADVSAELALDLLATVAEAGFFATKVSVGTEAVALDLARPEVDSLDVVTFVESDRRTFDVTTWRGVDRCSVIMVRDSEVDPAKLPVQFQGRSLGSDGRRDEQLLVTMRVGASAAEVTGLLAKVMVSPLMGALRPKLRFAWTPRACPSDGQFGHAR